MPAGELCIRIAPNKGIGDERNAISPAPGDILKVQGGWAKAIPARAKYSLRVACWYVAKMMTRYHSGWGDISEHLAPCKHDYSRPSHTAEMHIVVHLCTAAVVDSIAHYRPVNVAPSQNVIGLLGAWTAI